ncbi:FAD-dependent monooxygenase [Methylobacterium sp. B4]|uniref:FAD-dependent monooxygenase n=1 Tax=Methylobacterium sp. B4 TaxID=1938755 RepID=UPI000D7748CF|nr:FAD-dependent monooxygenase [Methylobacterium sp. B4]PXW51291.1 2-polyprenyl-6-methoxyphenol hydroxylase-like FAD-dependent oxidoreductase [Methylobacterium sp. B4]
MTDVLIVGAGPVGLTMGAELVRYGVGVRLIDRAPHATETSKALVVWSRTLELMDRMGCTQAFVDAGLRAPGASIRSGGKVLGNPRFADIASAYNFALMIPQRETERLLAAHLRSFGVEVERQVELVGFDEAADGVEVCLRHANGREETLRTPWLIGCDGAHSTVRHGLGLAFEGAAQGDDWLLADVRLDGSSAPPPDEIATYLHRDGPFVIFPIPSGRARVVATVGRTDAAHPRPDPTLDDVQALIDQRAGGFCASDPVWLTNFRINERKVAEYRHGRVFLAGDAAHIHSPAGGQGMNTGMQDAVNLAWKLAMVVHGQAGTSLLDSYSPERSAVGDLVLRNAGRLTDMATLSNPAAQAARNLALRFLLGLHTVRDRMATQMSEIEIAYANSPLSEGARSGVRWDPETYGGPPPGAGGEPRFVLYAADAARGAALTGRFPGLLETTPRSPPDASGFFLVRPDGYVGLSAGETGWDDAERYLRALQQSAGRTGGHAS